VVLKVLKAEFILSAFAVRDFLRDGRPEVAFVGRSNVGKSTLLNRLLDRRKLARTSRTPGRTRAVNYFLVNDSLYFVDLPGYGYAKAGKTDREEWARLVDRYFEQALPEAKVIQLVDSKVGATPLDVTAYEYLESLGAEIIVVATKFDKLKQSQRQRSLAEIRRALTLDSQAQLLPVSGLTGAGLDPLWREITASEPRTNEESVRL